MPSEVKGAKVAKNSSTSVIPKPPGVDPGWAGKIAKAREAREEGRKTRAGKPATVQVPRLARHLSQETESQGEAAEQG